MRLFRQGLAIAMLLAATAAFAQSPAEARHKELLSSHKLIFFGDENEKSDSSAYTNLIDNFYIDQFRHSQDPRAPYFMLMSRNADMAMGIGGQIEALGYYDFDGTIKGTNFIPYEIPIPVNPAQRNSLQSSMGQSSLFFTIFGKNQRFNNYKLYIQANFNGGNGNYFQLKKAYAIVGDWTLGYANTTFSDPASQPATVETQGPNSEIGDTRILLRYMHSFTPDFTIAASAEMPDDQIAESQYFEPGSEFAPNVAAFVQYGTQNQHIRLAGLMKNMRYRNLVNKTNDYVTGWGVNLTTVFRPVAPLTVYAAGNYGQGIGSLVNDLSCGVNDLIGLSDDLGKMYAPKSYGWYAALQYDFSSSVFSTVMFSQERMLPSKNAMYDSSDYKYGLYAAANIFWNITPRWQVGAEVDYGKRVNMDGTNRPAYRAGLLAQFSF